MSLRRFFTGCRLRRVLVIYCSRNLPRRPRQRPQDREARLRRNLKRIPSQSPEEEVSAATTPVSCPPLRRRSRPHRRRTLSPFSWLVFRRVRKTMESSGTPRSRNSLTAPSALSREAKTPIAVSITSSLSQPWLAFNQSRQPAQHTVCAGPFSGGNTVRRVKTCNKAESSFAPLSAALARHSTTERVGPRHADEAAYYLHH